MRHSSKLTRQIQLHAIGGPSRYSGAKEVGIFCPYGASSRHGAGEHRPVIGIAHGNSLQRRFAVYASFFKQRGEVLSRVRIGDIGREELHRTCIGSYELSHPLAQHRSNQDVGIQNDGFVAHATKDTGF